MSEGANQIRLGDLLTRAGLLKPEDLREGMLIAKQQSLPVGRVLIMAEFISEPNLQAAVQAQSMLKDNQIDVETAIDALRTSAQDQITLDEALNKLGWKDKTGGHSNKLGELLTEAGFITKEQLDSGLSQCQMSGLPLGRVLVAMSFLSEPLLASALNAQILVRDNKIARELAITGLKACHERQITIEQSLIDAGLQIPTQDTVRLGELFVMASMLSNDSLMQAVEYGLTESKPIGQVLVERKMVTEHLLELALGLQRLVAEGKVKKPQCGQILTVANQEGLTLEQAIEKLEPPKTPPTPALPLYQFLQLAGLITAKDIEEALKQGSRDTELMGKMLMLTGAIDYNSLSAAVRLNDMVTHNVLKAEQAILAMGLCQNRQCSVETAFKSLGWSMALEPGSVPQPEMVAPVQPMMAETGQAVSGQFGAVQDMTASGQFSTQATSGQHPQVTSGQHPQVTVSGQYPQVTASGQFPQVQQSDSGQFGAVQDQSAASGQYAPVPNAYGDATPSNLSATSDVPVFDQNAVLAPPQSFDDDLSSTSDVPAPTDLPQTEEAQSDDSGGKKKGGGKKRLADLMP